MWQIILKYVALVHFETVLLDIRIGSYFKGYILFYASKWSIF